MAQRTPLSKNDKDANPGGGADPACELSQPVHLQDPIRAMMMRSRAAAPLSQAGQHGEAYPEPIDVAFFRMGGAL